MLPPSWESWRTHAHSIGDCAGQKACSVLFEAHFLDLCWFSLHFFFISLPLFKSQVLSVYHGKCMYVFACLNVRACMCVSLRSQETLSVNTSGICSSVMLALVSVTHFCAIYMWCVQLQMTNICLHFELSFLFSLAGTELFVVVVQSICLLSERMLYTL